MVVVISGKDRGKRGKVLRVFPRQARALVEGLNLVKRHTRAQAQGQPGGIIDKEAPIHISNLMVICPRCNQPVRTRRRKIEKGLSARICVKCEEVIDRR